MYGKIIINVHTLFMEHLLRLPATSPSGELLHNFNFDRVARMCVVGCPFEGNLINRFPNWQTR